MDPAACPHAELEQELLPRLHTTEQQRYRAFTHPLRRRTWLAGRALLLATLARQADGIDTTALRTDPDGGVRYQDGALHLSLSHCRDLLAVGLAHSSVGVDIERLRPRLALEQVQRVYSQAEAEALLALPEAARLDAFYALWTLKEAACKVASVSLWEGLRNARFDLAGGSFSPHPPFPSGAWRCMSACVEPAWRLALAIRGAVDLSQIECWRMTAPARWQRQALARPSFLQAS
jgi:phosphopantetheinyl transferase